MVDIILKHKGTLINILGMEFLPITALYCREEHADLAVGSAIEMLSKLDIQQRIHSIARTYWDIWRWLNIGRCAKWVYHHW